MLKIIFVFLITSFLIGGTWLWLVPLKKEEHKKILFFVLKVFVVVILAFFVLCGIVVLF